MAEVTILLPYYLSEATSDFVQSTIRAAPPGAVTTTPH